MSLRDWVLFLVIIATLPAPAMAPNFVAARISGPNLTLSFGMANARTVTMAVPLTGFGLAHHDIARQ